jgi:hypothetical protein
MLKLVKCITESLTSAFHFTHDGVCIFYKRTGISGARKNNVTLGSLLSVIPLQVTAQLLITVSRVVAGIKE